MKLSSTLLAALSAAFLLTACETPSQGTGSGAGGGSGDGYSQGGMDSSGGELAPGVSDRVFFGYDSAVLSAEAQATLERQAAWLKQNENVSVTVEGHCDERGTREYNIALGERRAASAKKYLVSMGVKASRVSTISYGKERPAVIGSDESAWSQNRRAVTVVANQ